MSGLGEEVVTRGERAGAVAIAAAALDADPMYRWLLPGAAKRRRMLVVMMRRALAGCSLDVAREGGGVHGVIACHDPDRAPAGGAGLGLSLVAMLTAPRRALRGLGLLRRLRELRPKEPHVHIEILAVAEAARGRGVAKALVVPVLERARARGLLAHLETTNPDNIAFYERFGFAVGEEVTGAHPTAWVMRWRSPLTVSS